MVQHGGVSLGWAAEVAIAQVPAAKVVDAGQLLQLVKELLSAAVLVVATLALGACNNKLTNMWEILRL